MEYQVHILENGMVLLHRHTDNMAAHCGVFINAGSRDEREDEQGMAHFIEHTIFKGTKRRKSYHILNRIESVGGDLNAYTTKEETCIYASFLHEHYERTLELFSDLVRNSVFPEKEVRKEKEVIIDEINSYQDTPAELIYDEFEELIFAGHALAHNILGTKKHVRSFNRKKVVDFFQRQYQPGRMLISSVGKIPFNRLVRYFEKYFGDMAGHQEQIPRYNNISHKSFDTTKKTTYAQTHSIIGNLAYGRNDPMRFPLAVLNNLLGGPAMNSRLNLSVREKHGYSYHVESNYHAFTDTGIFTIYVSTDNGNLDRTIRLIEQEMKKLREVRLGIQQLKQARQQLLGQLALSYELNLNRMLAAGRNYLHDQQVLTPLQIREKIEGVTAEDIMEAANQVLDPERLSLLIYKSK